MENKTFAYYEEGMEVIFTTEELMKKYENEIDKEEYETFENWMEDMTKMQILIEQ